MYSFIISAVQETTICFSRRDEKNPGRSSDHPIRPDRYGMEEFVVLMPGTIMKAAERIMERLGDCIAKTPLERADQTL